MQGDRKIEAEFTIERGGEKDRSANGSSPHRASSGPPGQGRAGQAEFDLEGRGERQPEGGIPDRLRRKYYVAEAGAGDEAKVYADQRGEYLAFKVSAERMATRLEDAGVVRDMVSIAQHRGWKEVELRGSEEFRRTAWLEASVRGLSVRGYEPDPVDRAALAFRARPEMRSTTVPQTREAGASETVTVDGKKTKRPIDVTVMPPEPSETRADPGRDRQDGASPRNWSAAKDTSVSVNWHDPGDTKRATVTIDAAALDAGTSHREQWQARADRFRATDPNQISGDHDLMAARSQLAAIKHALAKAVRDPDLRRSVLDFAKYRIAEKLQDKQIFTRKNLKQEIKGQQKIPLSRKNTDSLRDNIDRISSELNR